jgi:hypothetical protein
MTFNRITTSYYNHARTTVAATTTIPGSGAAVGTYIKTPSSGAGYVNGTNRSASALGVNNNWPDFAVGSTGLFPTEKPTAYYYEVIVYESDKSADRVAIETNINTRYGIF